MPQEDIISPKTFISYSWTTPEHEEWVLQLATQLVENGVDVILDKWHLREGADKYVFMEKMVTDPDIKKVVLICDKAYTEKADQRKGGVGTETQVISREVYEKVENNTKFVSVIREKDDNGHAYLPSFLKSRIFIEMSDEESESKNFEQLLRWIFDRPVYQKPELGKPPSYIFDDNPISLGTNSKHRLALEALKQNKANTVGAVRDYFETFAENFAQFQIEPEDDVDFKDKILESITSFKPYRDEVVEIFLTIVKYNTNTETYRELHRFFESLILYSSSRPINKNNYIQGENDNLRLIVHELFLYVIAVLIKYDKFDEAGDFLSQNYYSQRLANVEGLQTSSFDYHQFNTYFQFHSLSSSYRSSYQNTVTEAELFRTRADRKDVIFEDVMQSDFILYLFSLFHIDGYFNEFAWYPFTLSFATYRLQPFEIFSRAQSIKYFELLKKLLIIDSKDELTNLIEKSKTEKGFVPSFERPRRGQISLGDLLNIDKLATRP